MKRSSGFTLPELMISIAMVAILLSLAVPSFRNMISSNRLATSANDFATDVAVARGEAIKRGVSVRICRSSTPASGGCTTSTGGWETGWVTTTLPDNTVIARASGPLNAALTLRGNTNVVNGITFSPQGLATGFNGQLTLCDSTRTSDPRYVIVAATGRTTVSKTPSNAATAPTCPPT